MSQPVPKTNYDQIVLLTDLTSTTHSALSYARAFAQYYSSRLTLLHALPDPAFPRSRLSRSFSRQSRESREELHVLCDALISEGIDAHVHISSASSRVDGLLMALHLLKPDLIIQGTAAVDDLRRAMIGSVAEGIFRTVKTPVMTVGKHVPAWMRRGLRFERVLMMTDFGEDSDRLALYALSLAEEFGAHITLTHLHEGHFAPPEKEDVERCFHRVLSSYVPPSAADWCDPETVIDFGDIEQEFAYLIQKKQPDLILMGAHGPGPLGTRGKPGFAFRVIARAQCPVLTMLDVARTASILQPASTTSSIDVLD